MSRKTTKKRIWAHMGLKNDQFDIAIKYMKAKNKELNEGKEQRAKSRRRTKS